jgi:HAE1 family hydrophobic/amphiphilic exporter-1
VTVRISGEDFRTLEQYSEQARKLIADVPNLVNLNSDLEATRPELAFTVDRRRAVLLGVNTATIGNFLKMAIFGTKVGTYRQFNDEYDITVRLPLADRANVDDLYRIQIPNIGGEAVPLSSLGRLEYRGGFGTINRVNQKRVATLTADAEGRLSSEVLRDVQERLEALCGSVAGQL